MGGIGVQEWGLPISLPLARGQDEGICADVFTVFFVSSIRRHTIYWRDWSSDVCSSDLDHYLDVELDLSEVMFIATANMAETIPGPLLDRMEVIRFDGYTVEEKTAIARDYLLKRQRERNGLREDEVAVSDDVLRTLVSEYTREAGVRNLERQIGTVLRKVATRIASEKAQPPVLVDVDTL